MDTAEFTLSAMSNMSVQISHISIDMFSSLNQHESHIHKECEIYLNLSGDVSFEVENRIYPISRGSVIITRPYEYHHCIYHSSAPHEHYWATFSAEGNEELLNIFFSRQKGRDNLILLDEEACNRAAELFQKVINGVDPLGRRIDLLSVLYLLKSGAKGEAVESVKGMPSDVTEALDFMDDRLGEDITVEDIARAAKVSVNTLERHFKDSLNAAPGAVLRKKRLISSLSHLRNGASVAEAAEKSGFADYSNYIQLFRKQFGMTPLQYKKKTKK